MDMDLLAAVAGATASPRQRSLVMNLERIPSEDATTREQPQTGPAACEGTEAPPGKATGHDEIWGRLVRETQLLAKQIEREATHPRGERRATWALAWTFEASEERIRKERSDLGLGLGELAIARALANATAGSPQPLTIWQAIGLRAKEGGWDEALRALQMAGLLDVRELGQVVRQIRAAMIRAGARTMPPPAAPERGT
jgi:hypothetical protein